ncbi:MAG: DUF1611 domain-containing protein [Sinobacteraceae bacterium]|nr:DUF1611 domain-containing protein [Nevskiaceae bacterium]
MIRFQVPFAVFLGDIDEESDGKTALGLVQWRREDCAGQIRLPACRIDTGVPDLTVAQARAAGVRSLIIGSAAVGGGIPAAWIATLREAASVGIDIVGGLHVRLSGLEGLAAAAQAGGARLIDVRVPPSALPVGTGAKRSGRRLLTMGTDCVCGKKYTALALAAELRRRAVPSHFRATGQTGIMIAGQGIPFDAVVSDFLTGAAELLSPAADAEHWDVIEGQGSLFHPGYLQVTVGLLVGSQPDAFIVCHDPTRSGISGWPEFRLPTVSEVIARTIDIGRLTNPSIRCVGVSLNLSKVPGNERASVLQEYQRATGLPCADPLAGEGIAALVDHLLRVYPQ